MNSFNTTIVALATAPITSAIHLIRLSGPDAYAIINKLVKNPIKKESYKCNLVKLYDGNNFIDNVILIKYVNPKSYTGEDMIEISCHGSTYIANLIIATLIKNGATLATNGEFTKRAYLNQKIDLLQASAINNVINSQSKESLKIAHKGIDKTLSKKIEKIGKQLFLLISQLEVNIDYPEYDDVPNLSKDEILKIISSLIKQISLIISSTKIAQPIINGINVAIIGKPNVGKSSLLNALLNQDKAIISNVPGTTRDLLQYSVRIGDLLFNFIDTAGIHHPTNKIEKIGINIAKKTIKNSDLILFVSIANKEFDQEENTILRLIKNKQYLLVKNKSDLLKTKAKKNNKFIYISAKNKEISSLLDKLTNFKLSNSLQYDLILPSIQNLHKIESVNQILNYCKEQLLINQPIDLLLEDLHKAHQNILEILGQTQNIDFIEGLFKYFCVGK